MPVEIRFPQITGTTEREQLAQVKSYLYQFAEQLQWAFNNIETTNNTGIMRETPKSLGSSNPSIITSEKSAEATFTSIKALIIKSADIVQAYYEEISNRLEGVYVAQSDFGVFAEKTSQEIEQNSTNTAQRFESIQGIINTQSSAIEELTGSIDTVKTNLGESIDNAVINANASADAAEAAAKGYTDDKTSTLTGQIGETASDLKGQIVDTNIRIDDTNGAIEDLGTGLEDTKKRLESAEGTLEATKSALSSSIQKVAESVSATDKLLESAKAQLKGSIDDLTVYVTGLKETIIGVEAYLKSGLLYYTDAGIPVYGIEIGQTVDVDGTNAFNKYARFTSEKLSFYDQNGIEVAYISDNKLYIKMAHITVALQLGGIIQLVMSNGDVVKKWVGTGG